MKPHTETSNSHGGPDSEFRWLEIDLDDALFLLRRHFVLLALIPIACAALAGATVNAARMTATIPRLPFMGGESPSFNGACQVFAGRTAARLRPADTMSSFDAAAGRPPTRLE